MSEPIKAGDLVMIVKLLPCCSKGSLGYAFMVKDIVDTVGRCSFCGKYHDSIFAHVEDEPGELVELSRLRRIDPPALPEDAENKEELPA